MRRYKLLQILICLLLSTTLPVNSIRAQMPQRGGNQVAIIGWTDDAHYLIRKFDAG